MAGFVPLLLGGLCTPVTQDAAAAYQSLVSSAVAIQHIQSTMTHALDEGGGAVLTGSMAI